MLLEFHDNDTHNLLEGTHGSSAGLQGGIGYPYQVEMWVQETFPDPWVHRAFCLNGNTVLAVWGKNDAGLCYVGTCNWSGEWQLPYHYDQHEAASITLQELNGKAPEVWAEEALRHTACAVVVRPGGAHRIHGAWELVNGVVTLVARAPEAAFDSDPVYPRRLI